MVENIDFVKGISFISLAIKCDYKKICFRPTLSLLQQKPIEGEC